jgi:hypothetical protein
MPDHDHGSPTIVAVNSGADGTYDLSSLNLFMPGVWRITIGGALDSATDNDVIFNFCILG